MGSMVLLLLSLGWTLAARNHPKKAATQPSPEQQALLLKPHPAHALLACKQPPAISQPSQPAVALPAAQAEACSLLGALPGVLPGVTVVMPVKGCRAYAEANWESQLSLEYPGSVEFLFICHSEEDAAGDAVQALLRSVRTRRPHLRAHLLISGITHSCSQKIHKCASLSLVSPAPASVERGLRASRSFATCRRRVYAVARCWGSEAGFAHC